jgi:hypothetical protein
MHLPQIKLQFLQKDVVTKGQEQQHQIKELLASLQHSPLKAKVLNKDRKAKSNDDITILFALFITSTALSYDVPSSMLKVNNLNFHFMYSLRFMFFAQAGKVNKFYTCIA